MANIHFKEGRLNNAINEYKLAIKYKKDFAYYHYNLGCTYLAQKEYKLARNAFNKAIKLKNNEADFYYNLALAEKSLNKNEKAKEALDMYNKLKG